MTPMCSSSATVSMIWLAVSPERVQQRAMPWEKNAPQP